MAKIITKYRCSVGGTEYASLSEAEFCETHTNLSKPKFVVGNKVRVKCGYHTDTAVIRGVSIVCWLSESIKSWKGWFDGLRARFVEETHRYVYTLDRELFNDSADVYFDKCYENELTKIK